MMCESVDLPEPFGPMIACTSPLFTVSESPWRISRSSTRTFRSFTSSNAVIRFPTHQEQALQPQEPSVFHAHMNRKMIVETATTTIGGGKIDDKVFSRRIITKAQIKTTKRN